MDNTLIGGLLIVLTIYLAVLVLVKGMQTVAALVRPATVLLPAWPPAENLLSLALVLVVWFLIGVAVRTRVGAIVKQWMDRSLFERLPGYALFRSLTQRLAGSVRSHGTCPASRWRLDMSERRRLHGGHLLPSRTGFDRCKKRRMGVDPSVPCVDNVNATRTEAYMLKRAAFPLLALLLATLAGCASTESTSAKSTGSTPAYVEGTWMGGTNKGASTMVVVLKQTGNNVMGTLNGAGVTLDGPIEGTVDNNSIKLRQRGAAGETPRLRASCQEISGNLGDSVVELRRAVPYTVDGTWMGSTTGSASKMVVVLKQTGNNVTGTLSGAGTVDGPIEGTVQGNSIQLRERSGFRETPQLKVSCEQISGPLYDGSTVTLRRIP